MNIEFIARKTPSCWVFDHEHRNTINEPLCNGTDDVLDEYYKLETKRTPQIGDEILIITDTEDFESSDTVLKLQSTNETGSVYMDMVLFEEVWLCPWLQSYFGEVPEVLYVQISPVNYGLQSFNKNYAHPYRKFQNNKKKDQILDEFTDQELVEFVDSSYDNGGRL